ncbi:nucleoside triphosphate pyrophosphohydrolase [Methylocapsa sp. D3K7]|uniref:nucleoside triphosphate pyrophosphohydrolase n=1 Tax=Methylocapsa sp. D3K7 TaxID=3041435 RepID=UPI00244E742C|nr:nucleoside triphosphate pyrophosphohydrolase [Methylocapsa sp. D3K7]WGJ14901.1 nucleoside triphosphate pyrophosphohydrolase [Methylocapsa sp. D3K7]
MQPSHDAGRLVEILAALRNPETGCAWDREQTFETIVPFTIEESYEVADAVARGDMDNLKEELGDLLLQVVFQARIAEELNLFDFGAVVQAVTEKMIRRHPHVFGTGLDLTADEIKALWEKIKQDEKSAKHNAGPGEGLLADIPVALPGLTRAVKLQAKASTVGFDWNDPRLVIEKIREETGEIEVALDSRDAAALAGEIGDLLFAVANLARHVTTDPEGAIRLANAKFERRFRFIEEELARVGRAPGTATLEEMETLWNTAKAVEQVLP